MHCPTCGINYNAGEPACLNCHGKLKSGRTCPACGALNSDSAFVCNLCAKPLKPNLKKVARERVESLAHATKVCPECESHFDAKVIFCRRCGSTLRYEDKRKAKAGPSLLERVVTWFKPAA